MLLGRSWLAQTNCMINWSSHLATLCINCVPLTCPSANKPFPSPIASVEAALLSQASNDHSLSTVWIQDQENPSHGWHVSQSLLSTQAQHQTANHVHHYWLPRARYHLMPNTPQQYCAKLPSPSSTMAHHIWVPKKLLHAQGYYDGATTFWVPKASFPFVSQHSPPSRVSPQRCPTSHTFPHKSTNAPTTALDSPPSYIPQSCGPKATLPSLNKTPIVDTCDPTALLPSRSTSTLPTTCRPPTSFLSSDFLPHKLSKNSFSSSLAAPTPLDHISHLSLVPIHPMVVEPSSSNILDITLPPTQAMALQLKLFNQTIFA